MLFKICSDKFDPMRSFTISNNIGNFFIKEFPSEYKYIKKSIFDVGKWFRFFCNNKEHK